MTGGKRPPGLNKGYYVQPTVFTGMTPDMRLWREEVFGPVLAAMTFKTEEEAVQLANASEFGLAGAVISADEQVRHGVPARQKTPTCLFAIPVWLARPGIQWLQQLHGASATLTCPLQQLLAQMGADFIVRQ